VGWQEGKGDWILSPHGFLCPRKLDLTSSLGGETASPNMQALFEFLLLCLLYYLRQTTWSVRANVVGTIQECGMKLTKLGIYSVTLSD
jgi:hypothetical protein